MKSSHVERALALLGACTIVVACGTSEQRVLFESESPEAGPPPLVETDAGATDSKADAGAELTSYCPSSKCPEGRTSCPNSRFPCDVNLLIDRQNCGACGIVCQAFDGRELYECIEGQCVPQCQSRYLDCDGISDNGCETDGASNDACGACGKKCLDPNKPCTSYGLGAYGCGCEDGKLPCSGWCTDVQNSDYSCGACDVACDPSGEGAPSYSHMYYGCRDAKCGALKCEEGYYDCNGLREDGCEVDLLTAENCGGCGNTCPADQECGIDADTGRPRCMCPGGKTFCPFNCTGKLCVGYCSDLATDRLNCGACGAECRAWTDTVSPACVNGACNSLCVSGRADCNGNESDGCEVNIDSDPRNCGGCGRVCDAVAGQACAGGTCVVEPCSPSEGDAGGPK